MVSKDEKDALFVDEVVHYFNGLPHLKFQRQNSKVISRWVNLSSKQFQSAKQKTQATITPYDKTKN